MKKFLVASALMLSLLGTQSIGLSQRGSGGPHGPHGRPPATKHQPPQRPPQKPPESRHPSRPDSRHYGRDKHQRFYLKDLRQHGDYIGFYWDGFWWESDYWPPWVFGCDVYFVQNDDGQWFVVDYCDSSLMYPIVVE